MKKAFKILVMCMALTVLAMTFVSCSKKNDTNNGKKYTYSIIDSAPQTWSPTDWQNTNEGNILGYTRIGLYDFVMNKNKDGYEVVCEMASKLPEDVTKQYAGNATYKVPADAEEGYAWTFELNKDAKWEDGTPITADDYIYGFQQFLSPEMKNYRILELLMQKSIMQVGFHMIISLMLLMGLMLIYLIQICILV